MFGAPDVSAMVHSYSILRNREKRNKLFKSKNDNLDLTIIKKELTNEQNKILESIDNQLNSNKLKQSNKECPECKRDFKIITVNNIEIDCCIYCKSYWFDFGELKSITNLIKDAPSDNLRNRKSKYQCPVCNKQMNECVFLQPGNLLVDKCIDEHGVYLESGELKRAFYGVNQ